MYGIYINCSHTDWMEFILRGTKTHESRTRNVFKHIVGERVALISTGTGFGNQVCGYATLGIPVEVTRGNGSCLFDYAMITGSEYDVPNGKTKVFYPLYNVEPCTPYPVPTDHINHGRSYTEWRG